MTYKHFLLIMLITTSTLNDSVSAENEVIIITSNDSPEYAFNRDDVRGIFSMRIQQWGDFKISNVYILPKSHESHIKLCKQVLSVLPYRLQRNWDRLIYTGTGQSPIMVETAAEMMSRIRENPGSIGYVGRESFDESLVREIPIL